MSEANVKTSVAPIPATAPVLSSTPIMFDKSGRTTRTEAHFHAAHGFVVVTPTQQSSTTLLLDTNGPEGPLFWRSRTQDMHFLLDHLDEVESTVSGLSGRLDKSRVIALGHSMSAHTVAMLCGMQVTDPKTGNLRDLSEPRIEAGMMLSPPGKGDDLAPWAPEHYPVPAIKEFSGMAMPGLVVTDDKDFANVFSPCQEWRADAYSFSPWP